ncbi:MAG: D-aminoacyl-tRNA deacylase [Trueperaceae bacterium]
MRALLQRTSAAEVRVDGEVVGRIGPGLVVLLGVGRHDGPEQAQTLARKVAKLRVFEDEDGRMNRSLTDVDGAALIVPQFTLYADTRRGNRPGFGEAAPPETADRLVRTFAEALADHGVTIAHGTFQATMQVDLVNEGPVTIWLDTDA